MDCAYIAIKMFYYFFRSIFIFFIVDETIQLYEKDNEMKNKKIEVTKTMIIQFYKMNFMLISNIN